jgi:hypothetical protein
MNTSSLRWGPTRASLELPNQAAADAAGIELPLAVARVVACGLSRLICAGNAEQRKTHYNAILLLGFVCSLPFERYGVSEPAVFPDGRERRAVEGHTAMRRASTDSGWLVDYWRSARNRADDACLPLEVLLAFVPAPAWSLVARLVEWGPERASAQVEDALPVLARTPVARDTRSRPAGSLLAAGTIKNRITCLWKLMASFVDLRASVYASPSPALERAFLEAWTAVPPRPDVYAAGAVSSGKDNSGPPIDECARRLRELEREYEGAPAGSRWFRERRLVLLGIESLYGIRKSALAQVAAADFFPAMVLADGVRGPVLRIYPRKSRRADEAYLLPLPAELAEWIARWLEANGFQPGDPEAPLFPSSRGERVRLTANGLGVHRREAKRSRQRQPRPDPSDR